MSDATTPMARRMERMTAEVQTAICAALEGLDGTRSREDAWERAGGGGGLSRVLEGGAVIEKAGVNTAAVWGVLPADASRASRAAPDGTETGSSFFAAGLSVVVHPRNPFVPTAHCNVRYFERRGPRGAVEWWFGGGSDLTPSYLFEDDVIHFHSLFKGVCDRHDTAFYPAFKRWCDEYFYLPHRGEARGVGGIFFDELHDREPELLLAFVADCARAFVPAYLPIVERRKDTPYGDAHRRWQEVRRGRYAEFNLVYDRGTAFGLKTGGRIESVLMSLPPTARWEVGARFAEESEEARLLAVLRAPRTWV
jgi:coproporphyrinogen III oxidase